MKRLFTIAVAGILSLGVNAQDLPKPSPFATVEQRVGLTDISVEYSRPGVKGRTIWGDLVPFGETWRAGANKATKFSTSHAIMVHGQSLPEGDYSIFMVPMENNAWSVIFNKETELWGAGKLDESMNALRFDVTAESLDWSTERLEYRFMDVDEKSAAFVMDWAGKRVTMKIEADPSEQAMENITTALAEAEEEDKWRVYRTAAAYAGDNGMTDKGLEWIKSSVDLKDNWYSYWVYAELLADSGDKKEAIQKAERSIELGKADAAEREEDFSYEARIQADIDSWK